MNNEPVAWMNESDWMGGVELDVITDEFKQSGKGGDCSEYHIPLYTHPPKTLTDIGYETVFDGENYTTKLVEPQLKTLTDEVLMQLYEVADYSPESYLEEARAILRKAQEK